MEETKDMNQLKVVLLGDSSTGKTSLVTRWIEDRADTKPQPTVGAAFSKQVVEIEDKQYCMNVWDTAGQETYRATSPIYCREANAAFIVFDLTRIETFNNLHEWVEVLNESGNIPFILVGNKNDLHEKRAVEQDIIDDFTAKEKVSFFETSAMTGSGVDDAFSELAMLATKTFVIESSEEHVVVDVQAEKVGKKCC